MALLSTDAVAILLDAAGDVDISAGTLQFAAGLAGFVQGADARIKLIKGEMAAVGILGGVPYVEGVTVKPSDALVGQRYDEPKARRAFTAAIAETPGFGSMTSMQIAHDKTTRHLAVTWSAKTNFGDVEATTEAG